MAEVWEERKEKQCEWEEGSCEDFCIYTKKNDSRYWICHSAEILNNASYILLRAIANYGQVDPKSSCLQLAALVLDSPWLVSQTQVLRCLRCCCLRKIRQHALRPLPAAIIRKPDFWHHPQNCHGFLKRRKTERGKEETRCHQIEGSSLFTRLRLLVKSIQVWLSVYPTALQPPAFQ